MDKLKQFIDNNRDAFEEELLSEGHLERFEKKFPPKSGNRIFLFSSYILVTAASIILLFLFINPLELSEEGNRKVLQMECETHQEIQQVHTFYQMQMNEILARMEQLSNEKTIPGAEYIIGESKRLISINEQFENNVLPSLPCGNEGIFAVSQHYGNSLESLTTMLHFMEEAIK